MVDGSEVIGSGVDSNEALRAAFDAMMARPDYLEVRARIEGLVQLAMSGEGIFFVKKP